METIGDASAPTGLEHHILSLFGQLDQSRQFREPETHGRSTAGEEDGVVGAQVVLQVIVHPVARIIVDRVGFRVPLKLPDVPNDRIAVEAHFPGDRLHQCAQLVGRARAFGRGDEPSDMAETRQSQSLVWPPEETLAVETRRKIARGISGN